MVRVHTTSYSPNGIVLPFGSPSNADPELRAMWADNRGFDEVLISKRMIKDHMPDTVLESLAKVTEINEGNNPVDLQ